MAPSRDGNPVPDIDTYNQAYIKNYKLSFSKYQKALNLSILNITTWSHVKAFKSNMREDNKCDKCGQTETLKHIFVDCENYAGSLCEKVTDLIQQCKSKQGLVTLSQAHIIYLKAIPLLTKE